MRFATLEVSKKEFVALVIPEVQRYWPIQELVPDFSGDMVELVQRYRQIREQLKPVGEGYLLSQLSLLAPIGQPPRNIFCIGKNYHEHAAEFSKSGFDSSAKEGEHVPEAPVVFSKPASTIIGPGAKVPSHSDVTQQLDYEAELALVIGKRGRGISKKDAFQHVWGYTIVNDFTARDLQKLHRQWYLGKSLDGFCPMGPYVVTADEVDVKNLTVQCWVNGELRQNSNTSQLIFDIPTIIETISAGIELQPGDIIATGTPAGVGIGFNPPRFLKTGDVMRIEISGLGVLENEVA
jgi:2-keto-4-pentenoate hydratase/2-oxohepta-3-ene-1,7-dioic acid hydratase in catechol pathway